MATMRHNPPTNFLAQGIAAAQGKVSCAFNAEASLTEHEGDYIGYASADKIYFAFNLKLCSSNIKGPLILH